MITVALIKNETNENNVIKLETPKNEPEIFDDKMDEDEETPLILTNEIENEISQTDQILSPAVRKIISNKA